MPVPVSPVKLTCRSCGRHHVYPQYSDVVLLPHACPDCGGTDLEKSVAGALDYPAVLVERLRRLLRRSRM